MTKRAQDVKESRKAEEDGMKIGEPDDGKES